MDIQFNVDSLLDILTSVGFSPKCGKDWLSWDSVWAEVAEGLHQENTEKNRKLLYMRWRRNWQEVQCRFQESTNTAPSESLELTAKLVSNNLMLLTDLQILVTTSTRL